MRLHRPLSILLGIFIAAAAASAVPNAPTVIWPVSGKTSNTTTPRVHWRGDSHTSYQVRLNTANNPDSGIVWDSGQVSSTLNQVSAGLLTNGSSYYAFAKIANATGWSSWSPLGYSFAVNTSYQWPHRGNVRLVGHRLEDDGGPFVGLGFSYMQALRRCKYDRDRYRDDLAFMASNNFRYMRALSMVGWYSAWQGKEIAPVSFTSQNGTFVPAWPDYWQQLRDMIDLAYDEYGIRTELTIFADAQLMPTEAARYAHMNSILTNLAGRTHKVMHLEVANEAWQNGFPEPGGTPMLRAFTQYLSDRTTIPVAITSNHEQDIHTLYDGSAADIATYHFSRDTGTFEGGWLPVRDTWWAFTEFPNLPFSSNEPIGPGSSVDTETNPVRLVSAACFAFIAKLPMYVYHTDAGVFGITRFEDKEAVADYRNLESLLPPDVSNWTRNDGKETSAPFTAYCSTANSYWTDIPSATDGCHRNIGGTQGAGNPGDQFVCYPQGIRQGGLTLSARRQLTFTVYNPITGAVVMGPVVKAAGQTIALAGNSSATVAYIIKGTLGSSDVFAPAVPTNFAAVANGTTNDVSWTNPSDSDFAGTMVRFKAGGFPTGPTDGTLLCERAAAPGSSDSYAHAGVDPLTLCYYAAFAYDEVPNYSTAALTMVVPVSLADWVNEAFDGYNDGNLGGQGAWATIVTGGQVEGLYAKGGSGKAVLMDTVPSGLNIANQIAFTDKTAGYVYLSFDVAQDASVGSGQAIGRVALYGSDSTTEVAKVKINSGQISVEYGSGSAASLASTTNLTWYNVKLGLNIDTKEIDLWLDGVAKQSNLTWKSGPTRISRITVLSDRNSALDPQKMYIDNLRLEPRPGVVAEVRDDGSWSPSLSKLHFSFDPVPGAAGYRYAIGITSGGTTTWPWTPCGTSTDVLETRLSMVENQNYYVSVQTSNLYGTWGSSRTSNGIKVPPAASIPVARALPNGSLPADARSLRGKLVSAAFAGFFYVQEPEGYCGVKVISPTPVAPGDEVDAAGFMGGSGAERFIDCSANGVIRTTPVPPSGPSPVVMINAAVGGAALNANSPGVVDAVGPNNIGLLATMCGKVTQRQTSNPKYLYIDDGCGLKDGTTTDGTDNVGVRVIADPAAYSEGSYVAVTGIPSCFDSGGLRPQMLATDVQLLSGP